MMTDTTKPLPFAGGRPGFVQFDSDARTETDSRMLMLLRCVLAFSAFAILAAPSMSANLTIWAYGPLSVYCIYSLAIAAVWTERNWPLAPKILHWVDVLFYAYLIAINGSTDNYFFMFFFYPILAASFSWGFREGVLVTLVSTVLFATFGLVEGRPDSAILIPASGLLLFGYVISYLGVYEHLLRSRLALLKEINNPWSPRFGVDYVHATNLDQLCKFYNADSCVLIVRRRHSLRNYTMYTATAGKSARSELPREVSANVADAVLRLPDTLGAYYHDPEGPWWMRYRGYYAYDFDLAAKTKSFREEFVEWINLLDTKSFVTVPYAHEGTTGRLFLTTTTGYFNAADIEFLAQAADAMATVVENMHLIEELISGAAEQERLAMSRDLHDTTIQPYIGLKLALDGLYREAGAQNHLAPRIADLIEMADLTIRDLRSYAAKLKDDSPMPGEFLVDAIAKQAQRLKRFYGIEVAIKSEISTRLNGRLAAEAFQIISEGLSNILRHTSAKSVFVNILCKDSELLLSVGNEAPVDEAGVAQFTPRSINERVKTLGGKIFVEQDGDRYTVVRVAIPLPE